MVTTLTFDCYGTLIDWDNGIKSFFTEIFPEKDSKYINGAIKLWESIQLQQIQKGYVPYQQLQRTCFNLLFNNLSVKIKDDISYLLLKRISTWSPFPDAYFVLNQLKNHFRLVVISNGPKLILRKNIKNLNIEFNNVISGESLKDYKPSLKVFTESLKRLGVSASEVLHVAAGYKYDIIPASALGIKTVWINRKKIDLKESVASYKISSLKELLVVVNQVK